MQLIQDASVDAVVIASPDPTHAEFVHACLQQRKPVLCEKPLATSAADALNIVLSHCPSRQHQDAAVRALEFKTEVLWSMLDAIEHALQVRR